MRTNQEWILPTEQVIKKELEQAAIVQVFNPMFDCYFETLKETVLDAMVSNSENYIYPVKLSVSITRDSQDNMILKTLWINSNG